MADLVPYRTAVFDNRRWAGFVPRPDDIFVCTPAKCGTTWMQTIVASLLWPDGAPAPVLELSPWLDAEFEPIEVVRRRLEAQTHRRFIKTHTPADGLPMFDEGKYVFVARDGRDAFMSMCNHMARFRDDVREELNARVTDEDVPILIPWTGDVHAFFAMWVPMMGFFEHVQTFWELRQRPNVLLVHYNDLKRDLAGEMRRVASFLEIDVPTAAWPAVVERCTFESMQNRGREIGKFEQLFDGGVKSFIFKGTNGRWRDVLTADELAMYAARMAEVLSPAAAAWVEQGRGDGDPRHVA